MKQFIAHFSHECPHSLTYFKTSNRNNMRLPRLWMRNPNGIAVGGGGEFSLSGLAPRLSFQHKQESKSMSRINRKLKGTSVCTNSEETAANPSPLGSKHQQWHNLCDIWGHPDSQTDSRRVQRVDKQALQQQRQSLLELLGKTIWITEEIYFIQFLYDQRTSLNSSGLPPRVPGDFSSSWWHPCRSPFFFTFLEGDWTL